jgi:Outer membrane protein beta-barrel domain
LSELEDILQEKFAEAQYPFDEENWEKADAMITTVRRNAMLKKGAAIFGLGIFIGVLVMSPFIDTNSLKNITKHNETPLQVTKTGTPITENALTQTEKHTAPASVEKQSFQKQSLNPTNEVSSSEPKPEKESKILHKNKIEQDNTNENNTRIAPTQPALAKTNPIVTVDEIIPPAPPMVLPIIIQNSLLIDSLQNEIKIRDLIIASFTKAPKTADSVPVIETADIAKTKKIKAEKTERIKNNTPIAAAPWTLAIGFGANYATNFSLNPLQGLEATFPLNPKLSLGTGIYYTYLTAQKDAVKTIVTKEQYDFGYTADITKIETHQLHYAMVPLFVKLNLNTQNALIVGANLYKLITVSNSYDTYTMHYGNQLNTNSKKTFGYSSGINTFDVGLTMGYQRILFRNLGLALRLNYGLMDIKKDDYYNENIFERNLSGQLMLTYKLH